MERQCDVCGRTFHAQLSTARACSSTCRARKSEQGGAVRTLPNPELPAPDAGLVRSVLAELTAVGREDSSLGQSALVLAARIASGTEPASAVASLNKELRATMTEALRTSARSDLGAMRDELAERRARA